VSNGEDWEPDDEFRRRPFGARFYEVDPYGRPFSAKPFSAKPFSAKPFSAKPFSAKPFSAKPFSAKPFSAKPFGAKPFSAKPFSAKPFSARLPGTDDGSGIDLDEWGGDIAELICERSAVMRLGATIVFAEAELQIPLSDPAAGFRAPGAAGPAPAPTTPVVLRPGEWRLQASVALAIGLAAGIADNPGLGWTVKADLAEALARGADAAFLGTAAGGPTGISALVSITGPATGGGQVLQRLRRLASAARTAHPTATPGWILHPDALTTIAEFLTANGVMQAPTAGRAVDTFSLLRHDGRGGGILVGYPFVTSEAAKAGNQNQVYFSTDWDEAWIGLDPSFVTVEASAGGPGPAAAAPGQVTFTASMQLDFALRRAVRSTPTGPVHAFAWMAA
jgi:hypothetical protein